ncbi:hypothetical protein GCM10020221_26670 [Streptomyces thioluteus]|uniref:Uncharacterized protein n=1 Tax=Streptomyces thioluteus TaxID=66431 RepID=A0ABN3WWJ9_STRTU
MCRWTTRPRGRARPRATTTSPVSFAQQADKVTFTDAKQRAWATTAGTFTLKGLKMDIKFGKNECFDPKDIKKVDD